MSNCSIQKCVCFSSNAPSLYKRLFICLIFLSFVYFGKNRVFLFGYADKILEHSEGRISGAFSVLFISSSIFARLGRTSACDVCVISSLDPGYCIFQHFAQGQCGSLKCTPVSFLCSSCDCMEEKDSWRGFPNDWGEVSKILNSC